ncbi:hypothetical protein KIPB_010213, partial [Kipferlia bialata]
KRGAPESHSLMLLGCDSDLVVIALFIPHQNVLVLRPESDRRYLINVRNLRSLWAGQCGHRDRVEDPKGGQDIEFRLGIDFAVLCILAGDDYLRALPYWAIENSTRAYSAIQRESAHRRTFLLSTVTDANGVKATSLNLPMLLAIMLSSCKRMARNAQYGYQELSEGDMRHASLSIDPDTHRQSVETERPV